MILITRPLEQATETEHKLRELGYKCKTFPLLKIEYTNLSVQPDPTATLLITSQYAAKFAVHHMEAQPTIVIGNETKIILDDAGFKVVKVFKDSKELLQWDFSAIKKLFYLAGDHTALNLKALKEKIATNYISCYHSKAVLELPNNLLTGVHKILFYSTRTAETFAKLYEGDVSQITCIAISSNVAAVLGNMNFHKILIALEPTEAGIFKLLSK